MIVIRGSALRWCAQKAQVFDRLKLQEQYKCSCSIQLENCLPFAVVRYLVRTIDTSIEVSLEALAWSGSICPQM